MGYITHADVEERLWPSTYVQLTDDTGGGVADPDKVDEAPPAAEGEVNSHLALRTAVPVDLGRWPELAGVLKGVVLDLVEYRLRGRRPPVPTNVTRRRDEAVRWLGQVARGEAALPASAEMAGKPARGGRAMVSGPDGALTRETLRDM